MRVAEAESKCILNKVIHSTFTNKTMTDEGIIIVINAAQTSRDEYETTSLCLTCK